eukprot:Blabericola_migrator_1__1922@NODE_1522_length_4352_cov_15_201867_g1002_i0_p2_GENE_NODE_1522_length_4352_cov_15_201867_g1002_i0NODE_1522_length_4352_cov_15_201867_g1002_i0_p2_ORF_typecomplete_len248_score36_42_NODE_1522_length_4352_cov_15_201867_g1002_i09521695
MPFTKIVFQTDTAHQAHSHPRSYQLKIQLPRSNPIRSREKIFQRDNEIHFHLLQQLYSLRSQVLCVLSVQKESLVDPENWQKELSSPTNLQEGVSYWVPQPRSLTYAVGRPGRFPTEFPFYLPVEYLNLQQSGTSSPQRGADTPESSAACDEMPEVAYRESSDKNMYTSLNKLDPNSILNESISSDEGIDEDFNDDDKGSWTDDNRPFSNGNTIEESKLRGGLIDTFPVQAEVTTTADDEEEEKECW